jgi:hypothetical protein
VEIITSMALQDVEAATRVTRDLVKKKAVNKNQIIAGSKRGARLLSLLLKRLTRMPIEISL